MAIALNGINCVLGWIPTPRAEVSRNGLARAWKHVRWPGGETWCMRIICAASSAFASLKCFGWAVGMLLESGGKGVVSAAKWTKAAVWDQRGGPEVMVVPAVVDGVSWEVPVVRDAAVEVAAEPRGEEAPPLSLPVVSHPEDSVVASQEPAPTTVNRGHEFVAKLIILAINHRNDPQFKSPLSHNQQLCLGHLCGELFGKGRKEGVRGAKALKRANTGGKLTNPDVEAEAMVRAIVVLGKPNAPQVKIALSEATRAELRRGCEAILQEGREAGLKEAKKK